MGTPYQIKCVIARPDPIYFGPHLFCNRKMQKSNPAVAHSALSHKLARAAYYIMRDQVAFRPEILFG